MRGCKQLCELDNATDEQLYDAGCIFSLCASAMIATDGDHLNSDDQASRNELQAKAISALKQAIAKGWDNFAHMQQDPDLASLRDLPEFKALVPEKK